MTDAPLNLSAINDTRGKSTSVDTQRAFLCLSGWQGYYEQPVKLIGETPRKYRIEALYRTRLAGRGRWLNVGEQTTVPKRAIRIES